MLGLRDYNSSDDEDSKSHTQNEAQSTNGIDQGGDAKDITDNKATNSQSLRSMRTSSAGEPLARSSENGPSIGPSAPSESQLAPGPAAGPTAEPPGSTSSAPQSPYTSTRQMVRNLTLPRVPNFDVPDSPPGSPPPGPSAKIARFLELKKQGVHFNEKLERSSALRNPSLLPKLREFAGISDEDQYATSLPPGVALPTSFPPWAYAEQLAKTQEKITKKREEERARTQREAVEFVPATASADSSRSGTPKPRGLKGSAAERVMAGLDKGGAAQSQKGSTGKQSELQRRGGRYNDARTRFRSNSRSPRRR